MGNSQVKAGAARKAPAPNLEAIREDLGLRLSRIDPDRECLELRCLSVPGYGGRTETWNGFFTSANDASEAAHKMSEQGAEPYITLNPCEYAHISRGHGENQLTKGGSGASDQGITRRLEILIDCDPVRPAKTGADKDQLALALQKAAAVADLLGLEGWPEPICMLSGNGYHLRYACDMPPTVDVAGFLKCLSDLASGVLVKVDKTVGNPARITKLAGVVNRKAAHSVRYPQRVSEIKTRPADWGMDLVTPAMLEEFCEKYPLAQTVAERPGKVSQNGSRAEFLIDDWLRKFLPAAVSEPYSGGRKWVLEACPFDPSHKAPDSCVIQTGGGGLAFRCLHDSCSTRTWADLRKLLDPRAPTGDGPTYGPWIPPEEYKRLHGAGAGAGSGNGSGNGLNGATDDVAPCAIPKPIALRDTSAGDYLPFPIDCLRDGPLRSMALASARHKEIAVEIPAMIGLVAIATCIQKKVVLVDQWHTCPSNLWVSAVSETGTGKSSCMKDMLDPFDRIQRDLDGEHEESKNKRKKRVRSLKIDKERITSDLKKSTSPKRDESCQWKTEEEYREDLGTVEAELLEILEDLEHDSGGRMVVTADITDTTLQNKLSSKGPNGGKILIANAEAAELVAIFGGRYTKDGSNITCLLNSFTGSSYIVSRGSEKNGGRGDVPIDTPITSMCLLVQPGPFERMKANLDFSERGLMGRTIFFSPPSNLGYRTRGLDGGPPCSPPTRTEVGDWNCLIASLWNLKKSDDPDPDGNGMGGTGKGGSSKFEDPLGWIEIRLKSDASRYHSEVYLEYERLMQPGGRCAEVGRDFCCRAFEHYMRIVSILHCEEHPSNPGDCTVDLSTARRAKILADWALANFMLNFSRNETSDLIDRARELLAVIQREFPDGAFRIRELHKRVYGKRRFATVELMTDALKVLREHDQILQIGKEDVNGRSFPKSWRLNPRKEESEGD